MDERLRRRDHGDRAREGGNTWRVGLKTKGTEMREKKAAEGRAQEVIATPNVGLALTTLRLRITCSINCASQAPQLRAPVVYFKAILQIWYLSYVSPQPWEVVHLFPIKQVRKLRHIGG